MPVTRMASAVGFCTTESGLWTVRTSTCHPLWRSMVLDCACDGAFPARIVSAIPPWW